ncbi:MAG: RHS repeat-associated core domain-containing protein, partial [Gemmatimonadaceae bacterium]
VSGPTSYNWPGQRTGMYLAPDARIAPIIPRTWVGSIIEGKVDPSGLIYDRNRYYDPTAGRFTQEDPIGLAGGVNLYGYAGGDPANNHDPFGLCCFEEEVRLAAMTVSLWAHISTAPIKNTAIDEIRTQFREADADQFTTSKQTAEKASAEGDLLRSGPKPLEAPSLMPTSEGLADEAVASAASGGGAGVLGAVIGRVLGGIWAVAAVPTTMGSGCGDMPCPKPRAPTPNKQP